MHRFYMFHSFTKFNRTVKSFNILWIYMLCIVVMHMDIKTINKLV